MAKLHRLPWQTPIPLPTLRLTPSTVEAPLRIASRISPRLMPSHRQMISGSFVLAMACLWGVKRGFGCASRNAAVFSASQSGADGTFRHVPAFGPQHPQGGDGHRRVAGLVAADEGQVHPVQPVKIKGDCVQISTVDLQIVEIYFGHLRN